MQPWEESKFEIWWWRAMKAIFITIGILAAIGGIYGLVQLVEYIASS